jgi:hypothetical protein
MTFIESILTNLRFNNVKFKSSKANSVHILFISRSASARFRVMASLFEAS